MNLKCSAQKGMPVSYTLLPWICNLDKVHLMCREGDYLCMNSIFISYHYMSLLGSIISVVFPCGVYWWRAKFTF